MEKVNHLLTNRDYYEIRLESIGGLGANLCGKMLGELGIKYLDLNSSSFSSYGSEKTGTPVKGFIRYCEKEKEIRLHSSVVAPDLLVVFHQALLSNPETLHGCSEKTKVILAMESAKKQSDWDGKEETQKEKSGFCFDGLFAAHEVYGIEAQKIAMETHSRINIVMLGAMLNVLGLTDLSAGERICEDTLGKKYPEALKGNLEGLKRGFEEIYKIQTEGESADNLTNLPAAAASPMAMESVTEAATATAESMAEAGPTVKEDFTGAIRPEWGYDNAPLGGVNPRAGSTVVADLSPSRQGFIPIFIKEKCINCGLCFSTCPDMVFQFEKGEFNDKEVMINQGLDYYHCKGCLRCVDVCPVEALVRGVESEHQKKDFFLPNKELLRAPKDYEKTGPDGYVTSESYLTEQRVEGGEV